METIKYLATVARRSICRYKIAAATFDSRNNILSVATNRPRFMWTGGGIHAEALALRKCNINDVKYIVIVRIGKGGDLKPIRPCVSCNKLLVKFNIQWR